MSMGHWWNDPDWRKPKNPVPLCPPQIPHEMARNRSRAFAGINGPITEICSGIYYFQFPLQLLLLQALSFGWWNEPQWTVDLKFAAKCRHFYEVGLTVLSSSTEDKPWGSTPTTVKVQYIRLEFCLAHPEVLRITCCHTIYCRCIRSHSYDTAPRSNSTRPQEVIDRWINRERKALSSPLPSEHQYCSPKNIRNLGLIRN